MIAIIAGTGALPADSCKKLAADKQPFLVISLFPEDNLSQIEDACAEYGTVIEKPFYKIGMILNFLKERAISKVLFIGKVDKNNLLKKLKFDWLYFKLAAKIIYKSDSAIMDLLVETLEQQGLEVISQKDILCDLFISPGVITGELTPEIERDIEFGLSIAKKMSECDIGQTVVVKDSMILAVEAIEGTDKCIKRGIELGKDNIVICKRARTDQSSKYDLPTLGPDSLATINKGEVHAIAWKSSQTFIADKQAFIKRAQELGITLVSMP